MGTSLYAVLISLFLLVICLLVAIKIIAPKFNEDNCTCPVVFVPVSSLKAAQTVPTEKDIVGLQNTLLLRLHSLKNDPIETVKERSGCTNRRHREIDGRVILRKTYTSPAGRNSYSYGWKYSEYDIIAICNDFYSLKNQMKIERGKMSPKVRDAVLQRDDYTCQYCGTTPESTTSLHVDHIVPISKGGRTVPENLQTLCANCNMAKGGK